MPAGTFPLRLPVRHRHESETAEVKSATLLEISSTTPLSMPRKLQRHGLAGWEPETLGCFLAAMEIAAPGEVLDIGSNIGVFAWLAASVGKRQAVAFEPTPAVAEYAKSIVAANGLSVDVEPVAMGEEPGEASLYVSAKSDLSSSLQAGFREAKETIPVPVDTVDNYCERRGLTPAVIKIDTESTEPAVIRGASAILTEHRPWLICEVLAAAIEPFGYQWFQITHEVPLVRRTEIFGDRGERYPNWLFAPREPGPAFWRRHRLWTDALRKCTPRTWVDDVTDVSLRLGRIARLARKGYRKYLGRRAKS